MGVRFVVRSLLGQALPSELEFAFDQTRIVIGRGGAADVRIPHRSVSEAHASVQLRGDDWILTDTASMNGTKLSGQRLIGDRARKLRDGDTIEVGACLLVFQILPLVIDPMTAERTAELARRLLRQSQAGHGERVALPRLCVVTGPSTGDTLELPPPPARLLIGRAESCQLILPDPEVSREHAELIVDLDGVLLKNLGSKNAIGVGQQVVESRRLRDGDAITLGSTQLLFEEPAQAALEALKSEPDLPYEAPPPTAAASEPATEPQLDSSLQAAASSTQSRPPAKRGLDADSMIYALAATIVIVSVVGLLWLLRTP